MTANEGKPIASPEDTLAVALSLARAGWFVFPVKLVPVTKPDGRASVDKRPLVKWLEGASDDAEQVSTWWAGEFSGAWIGVNAQASGIVVVDVDAPANGHAHDGRANLKAAGIKLPKTLAYRTRSGGTHHVYRAPGGRTLTIGRNVPVEGVDIRAGNGLMVYYGPALDAEPELAKAPDWALLDGKARTEAKANATIDKWLAKASDAKPPADPTDWADLNHDKMLAAVSRLIKAGNAAAYRRARAAYVKGRPDRERDWDNAAEGSVGKHGLPRTTLELSKRKTKRKAVTPEERNRTLNLTRKTFTRWLGGEYDLDVMLIVLAAGAAELLDGDPLWLLVVAGPGNAKTETIMPLAGAGARVVSSIASAGALLSATSKGERTKEATGGLLRELGDRGLIVVKDFTTIISQNSNSRDEVLAALREIYDGQWTRDVGTDGGRSLTWQGRLGIVGAVTTAWDSKHAVVASMGDRFVLVRVDSHIGRLSAGRQALDNVGSETAMRRELAKVTGRMLAAVDTKHPPHLKRREREAILGAANVVTVARTAVEHDYRGEPIDSHAPESPTRLAKQLGQVARGAIALGVDRKKALELAMRCARDSMPPLRLTALEDIATHPASSVTNVGKRMQKPRSTIDRTLRDLHLLGLVLVDEEAPNTPWLYTLAPGVDLDALSPEKEHDPFKIKKPKE